MKTTAQIITLLTILILVSAGIAVAGIPAAERQALIDLYNSTGGASWPNKIGWLGEAGTECSWYGVTCDTGGNYVTKITLPSNKLAGTLSASIGNFANLTQLNLGNNQLSGSIPTEIGNLANLTNLELSSNQLSGSIPAQIGNLANLTHLYLNNNQLSGSIPPEIGSLIKLVVIFLHFNQLSGSIPVEIGNLANLTYLYLNSNQLSGSIPPEIGSLTKLIHLYLSSNRLSGSIPSEIGNLADLTYLYLSSNRLNGSIPAEIGNLVNLAYLYLNSNQLSGSIPPEIGNPANLIYINLRFNALYSGDDTLRTFLNSKNNFWESTQTVAPSNFTAGMPTETAIPLTWTPIAYTDASTEDTGGYEVSFATTSGGPYTLFGITANKSATGNTVTGLSPDTTYYFRVRTKTDPHTSNTNTVYSEYTAEISATTAAAATVGIPAAERQALIDLYNSTGGANWTNKTGWLGEAGTECSWYGVTCNTESSSVTKITLSSNNLAGTIPVSLGSLTNLTVLGLSVNTLTGEIPPELGSLTNLAEMIISANQLSGSIPPELGSLTKLTVLQINDNQLTGEIPPGLGGLTELTRLFLHNNQLTGTIPTELGSLTKLAQLYLNGNQLSGTIPTDLGNLTKLTQLYLNENQLSGSIPGYLGNLSALTVLGLENNQLSGNIPSELGSLTKLERLSLYENQLTGGIPAELANLSSLQYLRLSANQLTGNIPPQLGSLTNLVYLYLHENQLTGNIPPELGSLTKLTQLYLNENQLTGTIPPELGSLTNLLRLYLYSNQLTGNIPPELGNLLKTEHLLLSYNQLSGSIPPELGNLVNMTYLNLRQNQLTGSIPPELGNLTKLKTLYLYSNKLSGSIPPELGNLTALTELYLNYNNLSGTIPPELGNLVQLEKLYLHTNWTISGTIPPELGNLLNIKELMLSYNQLSGTIPPELGNLKNMTYLNLQGNQLSGSIPSELGSLTSLTRLDLNKNQLSGSIPPELANLTNLTELHLEYNAFHTDNDTLRTFLNSKQEGGNWQSTQTVAPENLAAGTPTADSVPLTWTAITYTGGTGGYEVYYSETSGGPYTLFETTADKTATGITVTGLSPNTTYYFHVRTKTDPHTSNTNTVYSEYTDEVSATTLSSQTALYVSTAGSDDTGDGSESKPFASIQAAIDAAGDGDTVIVTDGTYIENIIFDGKNITVKSSDGAENTIIDGNQKGSAVSLENGEDATVILDGFTLTNGNDLTNNYAGGIYCNSYKLLDLKNIKIVSNDDSGIYCINSTVNLTNCIITGSGSNGIYFNGINLTLEDVTLTTNRSNGIYFRGSDMSLKNGTVTGSSSNGIYFSGRNLTLEEVTLTTNRSNGIYFSGSDMSLKNGTVTDSSSNGIYFSGTDLTLESVVVSNSRSNGIYFSGSNMSLKNGTVTSSSSNGVYFSGTGLSLENLTVSASNSNGIYCSGANPILKNVLVSKSKTNGIYFYNSNPTLINITVSDNVNSGDGGGIYCSNNSAITLVNSILWNNLPQEIYFQADQAANSVSVSYSDIQGGQSKIITNNNGTVNWLDGNIDTDPLFANAGNGDYHLSEISPCTGSGKSGSDMGAYGSFGDLIAYWKFDEADGNTAIDSSGNGHNGAITNFSGNTWQRTEGISGGGLDLTDGQNYVAVPDDGSLSLTGQMTLSCWVKLNEIDARMIQKFADTNQNRLNYNLSSRENGFIFHTENSADDQDKYVYSTTKQQLGIWYHVTGVYDGEKVCIYVNGVLENSKNAGSFVPYTGSADLTLGTNHFCDGGTGESWANAVVDDIRIYNYALSAEDIQGLYNENIPDVSRGLLAHYEFEGNANDSSGNGNNGTENGGLSYGTGIAGQAASFDGVDDYIEIYSSGELVAQDSIAVSAWIKPDKILEGIKQFNIFTQNDTTSGYVTHDVKMRDGKFAYDNWLPGLNNLYSATDMQAGTWQHVVASRENGIVSIWINGELDATGTAEARESAEYVDNTLIGARYYSGSPHHVFDGLIDDLRIYNRSLSEAEIQELSEQLPDTSRGLVAHYEFEGNANDSSGNGNNGTENGGVSYESGVIGQSASFDGTDDKIQLPGNVMSGATVTANLWIKTDDDTFGLISGANTNRDNEYVVHVQGENSNTLRAYYNEYMYVTNVTANDGQWHMLTIITETDKTTFYLDGIFAETSGGYGAGTDGKLYIEGLWLGAEQDCLNGCWDSDQHFSGLMDDVRIYNRAVSKSEIQELYTMRPDVSRGLLAHYEFEGNTNDSSGNGNDGTENGGLSYGTGVSGQAASFDGTDDYIQVSNNSTLELNRYLTISYFMAPQPYHAGNFQPVVCKNRHTGNNYSSWIRPDSTGVSFQQYPQGSTDGVEYTFRSETPLETGKWIHVAMLRDDTAVKIYLDGVLVAEGAADYEANEKGESLFIGYDGGFGYPKFKGLLDDLRIYNRALSPAEIQELESQRPDTSRGLVAYYPFNGNANDESGNGYHGAVQNGLALTTDRFGSADSAYHFDGVDDWINVPGVNFDFTETEFTFSVWFKVDELKSLQNIFWVQDNQPAIHLRDKSLVFGHKAATDYPPATAEESIDDNLALIRENDWNFATYTYTSSDNTLRFYLNGSQVGWRRLESNFIKTSDGRFRIGVDDGTDERARWFSGSIDELRVYDRALSAAEIQELESQRPDTSRGLVAYYPFNGNANDESGNGNNGTENGGLTYGTGAIGQAVNLDGVDDYIINTAPSGIYDLGSIFSISFWINPEKVQLGGIVNIGEETKEAWSVTYHSSGIVGYHQNWNRTESIEDSYMAQKPPLNRWSHITLVYNKKHVDTYLNGVYLSGTDFNNNPVFDGDEWLEIGANRPGGDEYFAGQLDDLRIYNRAISEVEIQELYTMRPDTSRGLVAYYPFNGNANDESGNENHGTVSGASLTEDRFGTTGSAYSFDGADDIIDIPDSDVIDFPTDQDFSIVTWVKVSAIQTDLTKRDNDIIEKWSGSYGYPYVIRYYNQTTPADGKIFVARHDGVNTPSIISTKTVNDDKFHHIVFIKKETELYLYIDGIADGTAPDTASGTTTNSSECFIGKRGNNINYFKGIVDEIRIYNRAISEAEIQELYKQNQSSGSVYVDAAFTGTETGSETAPYNTIAEAVANAAPNSTLRIAKGIYAESLYVTNISGLKLAGGYTAGTWTQDDSDQSFTQIIAGGSVPGISISNASDISVEGFILNTGLEAQNADNLQVKNCVLIGTTALQIQDSSNVSVSGCELTGISETANSGVGIAATNSSLNISGNFIHADTTGIYLNTGSGIIAGNSIHIRNTQNPGAAIKLESLSDDVRIENNVLYFEGNALTGILETGTAATPAALLKNHFYADSTLIFYHDENAAGNITSLANLNNSTLSDVSEKGDNAYHPIPTYTPCFETGDTPCMNITHIPLPPFPDTDSDGLPDEWETLYFGNLSALSVADPDNDGLNNQGEYENGTDPNIADSDQDGTNDGAEVSDPNRHPLMADAPGPDIYVDSNLSGVEGGVGSGTTAQPYSRISDAVSNAQPNSTLIVAKGEYAESLTISNIIGLKIKGGYDSGTWTRDTDIDPGLTRIISGASPAIFVSSSRQAFIEGMVIQNGLLAQNSDGLHLSRCVVIGDSSVRIETGNVAISYCEILGISQNGDSGFGVVLSNASAIIDSNFIHADTTAILFNAGSSGTVINNSLHLRNLSNPAYGIRLESTLGGNVHIENNVLYFQGGSMTGIDENSSPATPSVLLKNYFYGDTSLIFYHDADGAGDITSLADLNNGTLSDISLRGQNVWHEIASYQACISTEAAPCMDVTHIPYPPGADLDGDRLPDEWEDHYFGNTAQGPGSDPDADGLSNAEEYASGTDPANPDSDGDRISDAVEAADSSRSPLIYERTQGPVIYVDATYIGTELGTSSQPFNTISEALDIADNGASIYIAKGSYIESLNISSLYDLEIEGGWNSNSGAWTRDENLEPAATEIIAAAPALRLSNAPHTFIEGLFIQNGLFAENSDSLHLSRSLAIGPTAVRITDGSAVLSYNELLGVSENADSGYGVILSNAAVIIDSNFIHADTAAIVFNNGASGLVMNNSVHLRNLSNPGYGIRIESPPLSNVHIENNVLYLEGGNMTGIYEIGDIADKVILLRNQFYGDENLIFCHEINGNITDIRTLGKGNIYHPIPPYSPCFETEGLPCMNLTHIPYPPGADLDGDMLPDEWEKIYFDDTGKYSEGNDPDRDNLSNIEEYINGTDPTNPDSDGDGMNDAEEIAKKRNPLMSDLIKGGGIFIKAEDVLSSEVSDAMVRFRWQIAETSDFSSPVLDVKTKEQLTALTVPDMVLKPDTLYYVRVQTYDNAGNESEWSGSLTFKTPPAADDTNCNGIPDVSEIDDKTSDWDHNDIPDANQTDMKCVQSFGGDIAICLKRGENTASVESLTFTDPDMISDAENRPDEMPLGLISFRITTENPGDTAEVTVYFSEPVTDKAGWYKYDTISGWQNYSPHFHFSDDRKSAVLTLKDGGFGDADGLANGVIADPSGPATDGEIFKSGVFTVGASGIVGMDWIFDGGMYKGILGIFSLSGMESLVSDSEAFTAEAVRRILTNTEEGYIVFIDEEEGARFSGLLGETKNWNNGPYKGLKRFQMRPGDRFATVLIPDSTLSELRGGSFSKQPLFSLAFSNPDYGLYLGQIADVNGMGNAFIYEDMSISVSDKDYNDLIFQMTGVSAEAPALDDLVADKADWVDWRVSEELGKEIVEHIEMPAVQEDTLRLSVTLTSAAPVHLFVYNPDEEECGREGGYIAGASFEVGGNSQQIFLPVSGEGNYRFMLRGVENGSCTLSIKAHQGETAVLSEEIRQVDIKAHQSLRTDVAVSFKDGGLSIEAGTPELPTGADGNPLYYDFDGDGKIDDKDIDKVSSRWNIKIDEDDYDPFYDLDNDGEITILDITAVVNNKPLSTF